MTCAITVDPAFQACIPPLTAEEQQLLETSMLAYGCRDPLVLWEEHAILLDGHNRYAICQAHHLPFTTVTIALADREAALDWIDANQLGRRNLSPDQASLLRGRRYNRAKKKEGAPTGNRNAQKQLPQNEGVVSQETAERLATQHGVSRATIERDGAFAGAVEKVKAIAPTLERQITTRQAPPKAAVIQAAALLERAPVQAQAILRGETTAAAVRQALHRADVREQLEHSGTKARKVATGVYDVLVIDPPWPVTFNHREVRPDQVTLPYARMPVEDIRRLSLPSTDDAHLWLWTTHRFLPDAFGCLTAWGFQYVCCFVWHKPGGMQPIGLPQFNCEFALYARKGHPEFLDTTKLPTCFEAARGEHSAKPTAFYEMVTRVTAGRRLDMFARRPIAGFDAWGDEAPTTLET